MLMPKSSRRIVASGKARKKSRAAGSKHYVFMQDSPSGGLMYFNRLVDHGCLKSDGPAVTNMEIDEMGAVLESGDPDIRAIVWFPFYRLYEAFNSCFFVDDETFCMGLQDSVMLVHERISGDSAVAKALVTAIRGAWMELREESSAREMAAELIVNNSNHLKLLKRACGIQAFSAAGSA
jgi:hypothetical protein